MQIVYTDIPDEFMQGVRVLKRVARNKDSAANRKSEIRVSAGYSDYAFKHLPELVATMEPGERIYASCDARDPKKAARLFKERQLASEYDLSPLDFYFRLQTTWASCLEAPSCALTSYFLFDIDADDQKNALVNMIDVDRMLVHRYDTKNGEHYITLPFNPTILPAPAYNALQKNASILLAYTK